MEAKKKTRYPYRKLDGTQGETVNNSNLLCPAQIASTPTYRENYDNIQWEDERLADLERMERQESIEKEN